MTAPGRRAVLAGVAGAALAARVRAQGPRFPSRRPPPSARRFTSPAVEDAIRGVAARLRDPELAWLFANCFPNTLDTTVEFEDRASGPDTFVLTGDIAAMWLRDSSAQVYAYLPLARRDATLRRMIAGVIGRHARSILIDAYANAFMRDPGAPTSLGWAKADRTDMRSGVAERKWELDSLCHVIRLAHGYWRATGDLAPFDAAWRAAMERAVAVMREQRRLDGPGPYRFQRESDTPTDTLALDGYGAPTRKIGLIHSMFRPSDDACTLPFLIPANLFAATVLPQLAALWSASGGEAGFAVACMTLADELRRTLAAHGRLRTPAGATLWAYEVDGFGNALFMDDANAPSLLSLPWLGACAADDPLYLATRQAVLNARTNPYFFAGRAAEGVGGPHLGVGQIWPMAIIMRALTSRDDAEIVAAFAMLKTTHAGAGFMHESFAQDDPSRFTRPWFAWANGLFGELVLKVLAERPQLLT